MKIFRIVTVNIFGILIVLIPFILPIEIVRKGFLISKTDNYKDINSNQFKKLSVKAARTMYMEMPFRKIIQYDQNCFSSSENMYISQNLIPHAYKIIMNTLLD